MHMKELTFPLVYTLLYILHSLCLSLMPTFSLLINISIRVHDDVIMLLR